MPLNGCTEVLRVHQKLNAEGAEVGQAGGENCADYGGNSGIGLATAKRFVNEGAYVFTTGRRQAELAAATREIEKNVTGVQGNVSNLVIRRGSWILFSRMRA